jgi:P4 family phage/plasmid primase-like protien
MDNTETIIPYKSKLNNIICYEKVDYGRMGKLYSSSLVGDRKRDKRYDTERKFIDNYLRNKNGDELLEVRYCRNKNLKYGRINPITPSLFTMRKELRNTISRDYYIDIDMENSAYSILKNVGYLHYKDVDITQLRYYCRNTKLVQSKISKELNIDIKLVKQLFISLLYGGNFKYWCRANKIDINVIQTRYAPISQLITEIHREIKHLTHRIKDNNPDLYEDVRDYKLNKREDDGKWINIDGAFMAFYTQEIEVRILEIVYDYLCEIGCVRENDCVLCADGIMIRRENCVETDMDDLMEDIHNEIFKKIKMKVNFKVKNVDDKDVYSDELIDTSQLDYIEKLGELKLMNEKNWADLFYKKCSDDYLYDNINGWFCYDNKNNLINVSKKDKYPPDLLNRISVVLEDFLEETLKLFNKYFATLDREEKRTKSLIKMFYDNYGKNKVKLGSSSYCEGIIKFLKSCYYDSGNIIKHSYDQMDYIAYDNMVFDFNLLDFREKLRKDYVVLSCGYPVNIKKCDKIRNYLYEKLLDIFGTKENVKYYLLTTATSLFNNTLESFYIHTGSGGNGKGLMTTLVGKALGQYFFTAPNNFLTSDMTKMDGANNSLMATRGKRYILVSEPETKTSGDCYLNTGFLKAITGGDDITSRKNYCDPETFKPSFTIFVQCNNKPEIKQLDDGIIRRLKIQDFPFKFKSEPNANNPKEKMGDSTLKSKMVIYDYYNEFMLMLLDTIKDNYDENMRYKHIEIPDEYKNSINDYKNDNNPLLVFINELLTKEEGQRVLLNELIIHFKEYAKIIGGDDRYINTLKPAKLKSDLLFNNYTLTTNPNSKYKIYLDGYKKREPEYKNDEMENSVSSVDD